ncbi:MAG: GGDEF domain-containing protein [Syntrophobacteraceae bacterium]
MAELTHLKEECGRLSNLLQVDPLTQLYNIRFLRKALEREMERTRRTGLPTGLIMIDLDHFKRINDTYGHQAGNEVLLRASNIWKDNVRLMDVPCRYGGEEFTIILPGTSLAQSIRTAERLRYLLAASVVEWEGKEIRFTASFGVDVFRARDRFSLDDFLKKADECLLEAKRRGRNRVFYPMSETTVSPPTEVTVEERASLFVTRWPKA